MVNDSRQSPENPHFFQPLLPGFQSHLKIPLKFFSEHIDGKHEGKIVKLISDASRRTWKVKLEAQNLTQGWKAFVEAHDLRIGDVVIFRHEGDMLLHVTALGPSCCEVQYAPSQDEKDSDESGESSRKEIVKTEYDQSSSDLTCFSQTVTASSLKRGGLSVPADFAKRNGLNIGRHEIVLMNEEGKSWESELKTRLSGQVFICGSWKQFCNASKLEVGDYCTFRLLPNIEKPMFQLCSRSNTEREKKILSEEVNIVDKTGQIRFVKLTPTRNSLELGKQHLPVHFTRANELNKPMKIILVDKDKLEWSMKLRVDKRDKTMYIMGGNGWKSFCAANEVDVGESLTLEFVRGGEQPLLKFCSKIVEQPPIRAETRAHKRARVQRWKQEIKPKHDVRERLAAEGEPSRPTRSSNKSTGDPGNLQDTQFCSVSNHVAKVKQSVVATSACIRRLRAELMTAEHNLKASLQEINNIEEAIMGLKKFVK